MVDIGKDSVSIFLGKTTKKECYYAKNWFICLWFFNFLLYLNG
ncbi:hypothetical protein THERMOT_612 [Bathymodiolus thermophilus thioautotrophic gill symbiont]|nr:hypothetical protein THERMOT_612 [Bathymodiolus thermophilus thioautotrophic gill symbiont]